MVHTKNKKPKSKKPQNSVKKHGKQADLAQIRSQLDVLGLKIIQVTADGNCFFRALADQLEGNEEGHKKYRDMVVQYILDHRVDFEPFIEDEVPFDKYCQSMGKDGTWAGHMELQAASLVTRRNICIHQAMSPRWYIRNFNGKETSMIHLSYHDGEHYNSVRLVEDSCEGPAKPIVIKVDTNISAVDTNKKVTVNELRGSFQNCLFDSGAVKLVIAGTGCTDVSKIEQVLQDVGGDTYAAIEFLIAVREMDVNPNHINDIPCENSDDHNGKSELPEVAEMETDIQSLQCQSDDKKLARDKKQSFESKKKNKPSGTSVIKNNYTAQKGKKETKKGRKKEATPEVPKALPGSLPDVGALCI